MLKRLFIGIIFLLMVMPLQAQDSGQGVVILGLDSIPEEAGSLNPLLCARSMCGTLTDLMFPTLQGINHQSRTLTTANEDNFGLTEDIEIVDDQMAIFTIRDDLTWTDGTPITAYDVFYSYLVAINDLFSTPYRSLNNTLVGAVPLDEQRIIFLYEDANCGTLDRTQFPIIPTHIFEPDIVDVADYFDTDGDLVTQWEQWVEDEVYDNDNYDIVRDSDFNVNPIVSAGRLSFSEFRPLESIRIASTDNELGIIATVLPSQLNEVDYFIEGGLSVLVNPPYDRRDELVARDDLQIVTYPGALWTYISFNTADNREPQDAFDEDGERLDQGYHRLFGDVRVRQAIQLALDIPTLIETSVNGYGTPLIADQVPSSWGFNDELLPISRNIQQAEQLLYDAGWRDINNDSYRECIDCLHAFNGSRMSFELMVFDGEMYNIMATLIARQLRQIGIDVSITSQSSSSALSTARSQRYDAYLGGWFQSYPINPDHISLFSSTNDIVGAGQNTGSYYNEEVDQLLAEARNIPDCDIETRAEIYREIQVILQEDTPYIWLFAPDDMIVAQGGVLGFDPRPHAPFWNIHEWVIRE